MLKRVKKKIYSAEVEQRERRWWRARFRWFTTTLTLISITTQTMDSKCVSFSVTFLSQIQFHYLYPIHSFVIPLLQVFQFQLYSLTSVPPHQQKVPIRLRNSQFFSQIFSSSFLNFDSLLTLHRFLEPNKILQSPLILISSPFLTNSDSSRSRTPKRNRNRNKDIPICWNPMRNWPDSCRYHVRSCVQNHWFWKRKAFPYVFLVETSFSFTFCVTFCVFVHVLLYLYRQRRKRFCCSNICLAKILESLIVECGPTLVKFEWYFSAYWLSNNFIFFWMRRARYLVHEVA